MLYGSAALRNAIKCDRYLSGQWRQFPRIFHWFHLTIFLTSQFSPPNPESSNAYLEPEEFHQNSEKNKRELNLRVGETPPPSPTSLQHTCQASLFPPARDFGIVITHSLYLEHLTLFLLNRAFDKNAKCKPT